MSENKRSKIFGALDAMIMDFFYYDRKSNEELGLWDIPKYLKDHPEDVKEMVDIFKNALNNEINAYKQKLEYENL